MSFSGLKTATLNLIHHAEQVGEQLDVNSLCAAFSATVSDTLTSRVDLALKQTGYKKLAVAGGVAANSRIRKDLTQIAQEQGAEIYLPPLSLCGDNAAMIGKVLDLVVDGYDEEFSQFYGRTYADSPDIDGRVWIASEEALQEGAFVKVQIDGLVDGDLSGYLVEE